MSRDEAIEILSDMRDEYNLFGDEKEATRYHVLSWAIKEMDRKNGRWTKNQQKSKFHIEPIYICSCCGEQEAWGEMELSNYCPNCGARMLKGEEDE